MSAYIYLFQGSVINAVYHDAGGLVAANGYVDGSPFFAEYLVDFDSPAMARTQAGTLQNYPLTSQYNGADTYFATLLRGSQLIDPSGWIAPYSPADYAEYHIAANIYFFNPQLSWGVFVAGPLPTYISILGDEVSPNHLLPWSVGDIAVAKSHGRSAAGYSELWANVTLTSVTLIPEPNGCALLFGIFAWSLALVRRRTRKWR